MLILRVPFIVWLLTVTLLLVGCDDGADVERPRSEPRALDLIEDLDWDAFRDAFMTLDGLPHLIHFEAQASRSEETPYNTSMRLDKMPGQDEYAVTEAASSGDVSRSIFSGLHRDSGAAGFVEIPHLILEEDPPFLDPLNRTAYSFTMAGDTTVGDATFSVIQIERVAGEDRGKPYESVRLLIAANTLAGAEMHLNEQTLFYSEQSDRKVILRRDDSGRLIPREVAIQSRIKNLLSPTRHVSGRWLVEVGTS